MAFKETVQGFLPASMHDLWWIVFVWAGLLVALVVVLIVKTIKKKKGTAASDSFKAQNPGIPADHKAVMQQHNVHMPHDKVEALDKYIVEMQKQGIAPDMTRTYLLNAGWNQGVVDEALKRVVKR